MRSWLIRWVLNIIGLLITTYLVAGFEVTIAGAILGSIVLGIVNATIRPVLFVFTLPLNLLTLGLFTFVINGLMLWLVAWLVPGFELHTFWAALFAVIILMIISAILNVLVKR